MTITQENVIFNLWTQCVKYKASIRELESKVYNQISPATL